MTDRVELRRRTLGAPDTLRAALRRLAEDPTAPRLTRKEAERALAQVEVSPRGVGVVPFAIVDGEGDGAVLFAVATEGPRPDLFPAPRAQVDRVRAWLAATWPTLPFAGLHLHVSAPEGARWSGRSCELALALAALSCELKRAPDPHVVVTGAVGAPGQAEAVLHVEAKRAIVGRDRPDDALFAPGDATLAPLLDAVLPGATAAISARPRRHAGADARRALDALLSGKHDLAGELASRAVAADVSDAPTIARARWVEGALALHAGHVERGLASLHAAAAALPAWVDHTHDMADALTAEELDAYLIVALIDAGRTRAGATHAAEVLARLERVADRSRRWRAVTLQVAGSAHRAAVTRGALHEAADLLTGWSLDRAALVDQRARALGDLAEVARRAGDRRTAERHLDDAMDALADAPDDGGRTHAFLELFRARLHAEDGVEIPAARGDLPRWPALAFHLLRTRRGGADLRALHVDPVVRSSAPLRGVVMAEIAWHALHDGPFASMRAELQTDAAAHLTDDPQAAALFARVAAGATDDDLRELRRRAPYG